MIVKHTAVEKAALQCAPIFQAAFDEQAKPLVDALYEVLSEVGWRADLREDRNSQKFRCEFCGSQHANWMEISHKNSCFLSTVHKAIAHYKQTKEPKP